MFCFLIEMKVSYRTILFNKIDTKINRYKKTVQDLINRHFWIGRSKQITEIISTVVTFDLNYTYVNTSIQILTQ